MEGALTRRGEVTEEDINDVGVSDVGSVIERKVSRSVIIVRSIWRRWWVVRCRSDRRC